MKVDPMSIHVHASAAHAKSSLNSTQVVPIHDNLKAVPQVCHSAIQVCDAVRTHVKPCFSVELCPRVQRYALTCNQHFVP